MRGRWTPTGQAFAPEPKNQKGPASLKSARQQENDDNDQDYPDDADAAVTKPIAVAGADVPAAEPTEK
jgi:hypothetical protein